jgi:pilus assembly protein CpaB
LIASIGINQAMTKPTAEPIEQTETTSIFVAKQEIGLGDMLKPEFLNLEQCPNDRVPPGAITKLEELEGRRTRVHLYPGEAIIEPKLLAKGEQVSGATEHIAKGMRAVSIKVDSVSGAASLIKPGDRVDVLVYLQENQSRGIRKTVTQTFLQRAKVFAVDDVFRRDNDGKQSIAAKTISLEVTPSQAELVTMASELGMIRLVLRSASDENEDVTKGVTASDLLGDAAEQGPPTVAAIAPAAFPPTMVPPDLTKVQVPPDMTKMKVPPVFTAPPEPAKPRNTFKMVMLLGADERKEVDFEDGKLVSESDSGLPTDPPANEPAGPPDPRAQTLPPWTGHPSGAAGGEATPAGDSGNNGNAASDQPNP